MNLSKLTYADLCKIHFANGYDKYPAAQHALNCVGNQLDGAAWANAYSAASFADYADAVDAIDEEN